MAVLIKTFFFFSKLAENMLQRAVFTFQGPPLHFHTRPGAGAKALLLPSSFICQLAGWSCGKPLILGILESSLTQISWSCSIIRKGRPDGFAQSEREGSPRHLFVPLKPHLTVLFPVPFSLLLLLHTASYVSTLIYAEQRGKGPFKRLPPTPLFLPWAILPQLLYRDRDGRENFKWTMGSFFFNADSHLPFKLAFRSEVEREECLPLEAKLQQLWRSRCCWKTISRMLGTGLADLAP